MIVIFFLFFLDTYRSYRILSFYSSSPVYTYVPAIPPINHLLREYLTVYRCYRPDSKYVIFLVYSTESRTTVRASTSTVETTVEDCGKIFVIVWFFYVVGEKISRVKFRFDEKNVFRPGLLTLSSGNHFTKWQSLVTCHRQSYQVITISSLNNVNTS